MKRLFKNHSKLIKGIIAFILFFSSAFIQVFIAKILNLKTITPKWSIILNFIGSLIVTIFLLILYRKDLKEEFKKFKNYLYENLDIGIKYWLIGLVGMMLSNLFLSIVLNAGQAKNEELVQKMIETLPYLLIISAGILAPITEEIVFRKVFKDNIKNKIVFALVAGIIFGYMHVTGATSLLQFLYIIPYSCLGISFAVMYNKTDTVFTSITMHMVHNLVLTILSITL